MLYAADIHLIPATQRGKDTKGYINNLARIRHQAALSITRTMRSMASDTVDAHANLLPFPLLISKIVLCATVRIAGLPDRHTVTE
jgi:hypothetical protein